VVINDISSPQHWLVDEILEYRMVSEEFKGGSQKIMPKFMQGISMERTLCPVVV
jgi:hypothetical protein